MYREDRGMVNGGDRDVSRNQEEPEYWRARRMREMMQI